MNDVGIEVELNKPFEPTVDSVAEALKNEGFGVLTRIDVKKTLKEKINQDFRPYLILGACNPQLSHRALTIDPEIGLLLPCNVTIEERDDQKTIVRFANPKIMFQIGKSSDNKALSEIAEEAYQKINRAAGSLKK